SVTVWFFFFFRQKTAYEHRLSLEGSEMYIRVRGGERKRGGDQRGEQGGAFHGVFLLVRNVRA
ncbi:hypothetical protein ABB22_12970, partial [Stenotrophomonas nitritireducens]